jgi:hypothetical protein
MESSRQGNYLEEGTGRDPCPGWRGRLFTARSAVGVVLAPYPGISVPDTIRRTNLSLVERLRAQHDANPRSRHTVTITGVLVRTSVLGFYRRADGSYIDLRSGTEEPTAAILVATSIVIEDP